MSALTEKVAQEHFLAIEYGTEGFHGHEFKCACLYSADSTPGIATHIAEVTEAAVRAQVAAEIRALEHTREQADEHVRLGGSVGEVDWYDIAIADAADAVLRLLNGEGE